MALTSLADSFTLEAEWTLVCQALKSRPDLVSTIKVQLEEFGVIADNEVVESMPTQPPWQIISGELESVGAPPLEVCQPPIVQDRVDRSKGKLAYTLSHAVVKAQAILQHGRRHGRSTAKGRCSKLDRPGRGKLEALHRFEVDVWEDAWEDLERTEEEWHWDYIAAAPVIGSAAHTCCECGQRAPGGHCEASGARGAQRASSDRVNSFEPAENVPSAQCPLCISTFDETDLAMESCKCGYRVCFWCVHRLSNDGKGCPACRSALAPQPLHTRPAPGGQNDANVAQASALNVVGPNLWGKREEYQVIQKQKDTPFGAVYEAKGRSSGKDFSIKVMRKAELAEALGAHASHVPPSDIRFAEIVKGSKHVMQVEDHFEDGNCFYVVFELTRNGNLLQLLKQKEPQGFDELQARSLVMQACKGLEFLHKRRVAIQDVSLESMLLFCADEHSGNYTVKICVPTQAIIFELDSNGAELPADFRGLVGKHFRPPELYQQKPYCATKVDSWCLGWSTFCMLAARPPFTSADPAQQDAGWALFERGDLAAHLQQSESPCSRVGLDFVLRLLEIEPSRRMSVADSLGHAWLSDVKIPPTPALMAASGALSAASSVHVRPRPPSGPRRGPPRPQPRQPPESPPRPCGQAAAVFEEVLDVGGGGQIREELLTPRGQVAAVFEEVLDVGGSGRIREELLMRVLLSLGLDFTEEQASMLVSAAGVKDSGGVDYAEFVNWLMAER